MSSLKKDLIKYTPRQEQSDALDFIIKAKEKKPDTKFFLLNMPVGVGKSHLAMMISDWYSSKIDNTSKIDIITAGKILQDQYDETYDSIANLKGKENYSCSQYACSCASGKEFNRLNKTSCDFCPYDDAKVNFITGRVALTNFHLYLIYALYNNSIMDQRKSNVLIVDEAHEFDDVMSDFISIKITENVVKKLKFTNEDNVLKALKKVKNISDYISFLNYFNDELLQTIEDIDKSMQGGRNPKQDKRDLRLGKILGTGQNADVKLMQIISDLKQYKTKIDIFLKEYKENPHNWVLETYHNEKTNQKELSLEPIWAYDYLDKYVWSNYDMVILMSGTILDKNLFSELNGLDVDRTVYYSVSSPFPIENRPIYYMPLGKMSYAKKEETFKNYVSYLHKILRKYEGQKGIIHTNSFELSKWIEKDVENSRLIFHDSSSRDEMLRKHFETTDPTVFVSPSVSTGVSFDHEKSRFQVIAKIPYPSLGSQKNKMRQKNNPDWYSWKTVCGILQMCGRSIRSKTDFADTIIIDGSFSDILRYSSHLIPNWVQESIKKVEVKIA
jgi:ATP-dependent DNA helicase DinG